MLAALQNKEVDYACIVEPWITLARKDTQNFKVIGNYYPVSGSSPALVASYVATQKTIQGKKVLVDKFIAAMEEATDFIIKDEKTARKFLLKYIKLSDSLVNEVAMPEFGTSIKDSEWDKIIHIIYQPEFNINKAFLPKPENKVSIENVRYTKS